MGTEIVYRVRMPDGALDPALRTVSRILRGGHRVLGLTLSVESNNLQNLARAHRSLRSHAEELRPISWSHEWPEISRSYAEARIRALLAWALRSPSSATAIARIACRLSGSTGDRQAISYIHNENWPGTIDLPALGLPGSPRETGTRLLGALDLYQLAVAFPNLDGPSLQGMEIRSDADQASLKILGIRGEHPLSIMVTPYSRVKAVSLFRRLLRTEVEHVFGCSLEIGGNPEVAMQAHRARLVPLRSAGFSATIRKLTPALVRRVAALSDQTYASWMVNRRPVSDIRWFDVRLSNASGAGYEIEILSKDFWQEEAVERLARLWKVELEHVGEE